MACCRSTLWDFFLIFFAVLDIFVNFASVILKAYNYEEDIVFITLVV